MLKISDADSAENNSGSSHYVVTPLSCSLPNRREGGPKASGEERLKILPGTRLHSICGSEDDSEQYYCNYGVNEEYEKQFQAAGLSVSARGIHGETVPSNCPTIASLSPLCSSRNCPRGRKHRTDFGWPSCAPPSNSRNPDPRRAQRAFSHGKLRAKAAEPLRSNFLKGNPSAAVTE